MQQTSMRDAFLSKLSNQTLYRVPKEEHWGCDPHNTCQNWFEYLASIDHVLRDNVKGVRNEFPYISYNAERFKRMVFPLLESAKSFIDVGCGGGDKLALVKAAHPSVRVVGVEHDPTMAIWASLYADTVFCQDALTLDYSTYDVIYAYWPIADHALMRTLGHRILSHMKPKAKFVLVGFSITKETHERAKEIISGCSY